MKWLYFLLLVLHSCIVCNGVVARNISARPNVVNIGAFFSFNSTIGRAAKIAVEAAVDDVNSNSSVLGSTKLVVKMQDTNCSGFLGIVEGLQIMEEDIVAVIGPQSSVVAHVLSHVANELKVPMLSFSATDPTLNSLQYPFFLRTTQSDLFQMTAIADLVQYYNWNQVAVIYIDNDYGRNGVSVLGDKLAQRRCKISYKAKLPPVYTRRDVTDLLVKLELMESRVFVLHVNPDSGLTVLSVAQYLGMLGNGCVWIATDWLSSYLDSSVSLQPESTSFMQGVIGFRQHIRNSSRKTAFMSRWTKLVQKENSGNVGINSYALYAYDTVWMVARAVGAFLDAGGTISFSNASRLAGGNLNLEAMTVFDSGKILLDEIVKTDMVGLTGPVHFDSNHDIVQPAYDIINVIGTGHRTIGYWSNYSGLSVVPPETLYVKILNGTMVDHQLYSVIWPGETTSKPRGWVFPNNGKELKVGVPYRTSYKDFVTEVRGTDNMKGFCIDVFTAAVGLLPYPVPYKFIPFGDGLKNPSYSKLVNMVASEEFDAAIGDIAIVTNRTKIVDFTQPYIESGLVILAPVKKRNSNTWAFLQPFTLEMWCATGGFFLVVGAVIWILEHRLNDDFRGPPSRQLVTIIWFSFSTLFFAHKENTVSMLGRLVLIIWLFVVLIVQSSYTASLTSILTVQQLSSPIKGIDSLIASNAPIGFQVGSFAENYMVEELGISRSRLRSLGSPEDYSRALELGPENGGVAAVVDERPYVELFLSTQCKFSVIGSEFTKSGWGFAFPRDSPLAVDMSTAILTLSENGDLHRIHDKWLSRSACSTENELDSERLHLHSFYGLFLICGVAFVIVLIIYFILVLRQFLKQLRSDVADPSEPGSSRSVRGLQSFLSFADEKEEDSKHRSTRRQLEGSSSHGNDSRKARNGSELTTIS